jgi:hypothetical protein
VTVEVLVRVVSRWFVAGFVLAGGRCVRAAPVLRREFLGKTADECRQSIRRHRWQASVIVVNPEGA